MDTVIKLGQPARRGAGGFGPHMRSMIVIKIPPPLPSKKNAAAGGTKPSLASVTVMGRSRANADSPKHVAKVNGMQNLQSFTPHPMFLSSVSLLARCCAATEYARTSKRYAHTAHTDRQGKQPFFHGSAQVSSTLPAYVLQQSHGKTLPHGNC